MVAMFALAAVLAGGGEVEPGLLEEDLSSCRLPNGITTLGERMYGGRKNIFEFSSGKMVENPIRTHDLFAGPGEKPLSLQEYTKIIAEKRVGDLLYLWHDKRPHLLVFSGRHARLGKCFLYEAGPGGIEGRRP